MVLALSFPHSPTLLHRAHLGNKVTRSDERWICHATRVSPSNSSSHQQLQKVRKKPRRSRSREFYRQHTMLALTITSSLKRYRALRLYPTLISLYVCNGNSRPKSGFVFYSPGWSWSIDRLHPTRRRAAFSSSSFLRWRSPLVTFSDRGLNFLS